MKIHFNGAAKTVTGSQILIEINKSKILLECDLYQGKGRIFMFLTRILTPTRMR